jgi:sec-independent protein translocase protein TatA
MFGLRLPELLIILVVLVVMFGAKKLPDLGDALGRGLRAFKKASDGAIEKDDSSGATPKAQQGQLPQGSPAPTLSSAAGEKAGKKV